MPDGVVPVVRIAGVDKTFVTDRSRVTTALQGIDLKIPTSKSEVFVSF
jgi:hypothetical protein